MNLKHKTDINAMAQCMLLDREKDILGSLDIGQAVVKLQGRISKPFEVHLPLFEIQKGIISDDYIQQHMQHITSSPVEADFRLAWQQSEHGQAHGSTSKKAPLAQNLELAFLRDILEYPDSGIAARYKRLGLSVRQGQKIRHQAAQDELIEETLQTTASGRTSVISLTDKGRRRLSDIMNV